MKYLYIRHNGRMIYKVMCSLGASSDFQIGQFTWETDDWVLYLHEDQSLTGVDIYRLASLYDSIKGRSL